MCSTSFDDRTSPDQKVILHPAEKRRRFETGTTERLSRALDGVMDDAVRFQILQRFSEITDESGIPQLGVVQAIKSDLGIVEPFHRLDGFQQSGLENLCNLLERAISRHFLSAEAPQDDHF